jgi:hypothetical protein
MKKSIILVCAMSLIIGLTAIVLFAQNSVSAPVQWEYKLQYNINEKKCNELGEDGWELVSVADVKGLTTYAFKRKKP